MASADSLERKDTVWISWNPHRRTTGLCAAWDIPLYIIRSERSGVWRWVEQAVETLRFLRRQQPEVLFVQNPSLALTTLAILARRLFSYYLVVDAHNEGVRPFDRPGAFVGWLTRRLLQSADATIVTNAALAKDVRKVGGRPLVLPDSLPVPPALPAVMRSVADGPYVAVIASFRPDEPIAAIIAAAETMPEVQFVFSGDARRFRGNGNELPANVRLAGFLAETAYWRFLTQAAITCDLTLKPDCLVCGAYEALAVGKAMVLSDDPSTREIFGSAAVLTGNGPQEIAKAINAAIERRRELEENARKLRDVFRTKWQAQAATTWEAIQAGASVVRRGMA